MSLKGTVSVVATLAVAVAVFAMFKGGNNRDPGEHWVELTVTFTPTPRINDDDAVYIVWSLNNTQAKPTAKESPWKVDILARTGDTVGVTAHQNVVLGVMSCRIKIDRQQVDHDMRSDKMVTCAAVV